MPHLPLPRLWIREGGPGVKEGVEMIPLEEAIRILESQVKTLPGEERVPLALPRAWAREIGRASCRERV